MSFTIGQDGGSSLKRSIPYKGGKRRREKVDDWILRGINAMLKVHVLDLMGSPRWGIDLQFCISVFTIASASKPLEFEQTQNGLL